MRQFNINAARLAGSEAFRERLDYVLRRSLPASLRTVIAIDADSRDLAELVAARVPGEVQVVMHDDIDRLDSGSSDAIAIVGLAIESGRTLMDVSRDLRSVAPRAPLLYLAGMSKTTGEAKREALERTLERTHNPFPYQFIAGPDYTQQFGILLRYIAQQKPGAKVAFVYSDTEFGRDPIESSRGVAKELGLNVAIEIMTPPGAVDVSTEMAKLRRARADYTIFHGYILGPIPEFISQSRQLGLQTQFMGTFWTMDNSTVMQMGEAAEGFMGVMPYNYYYDDSAPAPMLEKIRSMRTEYQNVPYIQGFLSAMLYAESARRTLAAGQEMSAANLKAALNSIENFDTGGLIGVPISIRGNTIPVGRIYRADVQAKRMVPASDWIVLE